MASNSWLNKLARLRRQRRLQTASTLGLVTLGPALVVVTLMLLGPLNTDGSGTALRLVLLVDFIYILIIAALVLARVVRMVADRRRRSAGSRLHLRLTGVFALVAFLPTVLVAVFAVLTVSVGLEGWFSERVQRVVGASLDAAEAYEREQRTDLVTDAEALAAYFNVAKQSSFFLDDGRLRVLLTEAQKTVQRGLREAYLIDGAGELKSRGQSSYLFDFEKPSPEELARALRGETVVIQDWENNEFRALVHLDAYADRYLYVSREVDGSLLSLLDETKEQVRLYDQVEHARGSILFGVGLLYLGFALILILAAVWLGLWFAERLSRPVGRLAAAAEKVGEGNLDIRVMEEEGDDEIAMLGRIFNQMTHQLKGQRNALVETHRQEAQRRRLFDSVLSSVTAGVIGLDADGDVDFVNRAAQRLLDFDEEGQSDIALAVAVPEFGPLFERLRDTDGAALQEEVRLSRNGRMEILLVRMSGRRSGAGALEGYVVAFDDVTDLVGAQRMAAWGDVARRIAHEIKNPLTPIQLSAERIKRKFRREVAEPEELEQLADVIVRQTNDLRRIVDEFSKFARMPEPDRRETDLVKLLRDAVTLQAAGQPDVTITADLPEGPVMLDLDATMIGQAMTNLIKNAGEAIEGMQERGAPPGYRPEIRLRLAVTEDQAEITVADNGCGLPPDRTRLFEPYVTTREKGTGLGLPIVKKIIEEHGGTLALTDAPPFSDNAHSGAQAEIILPRGQARITRRGRHAAVGGQGDA
ncbi:sensor histidine kinase NtrY-like [Gemmobacter caeruleus]|uniref:sensor histidine kinase NtrY-like n=1 Tax=Gemmobacter caeruleus TaxID=2595004 RepID=UPI0011EDB5F7|nr:PAS domain-containing sensor histidine kinase [Gemmobacter caeruleus]